jgi:hypothetical protein
MDLHTFRNRLSIRSFFKDKQAKALGQTHLDAPSQTDQGSSISAVDTNAEGVGDLNITQCLEVIRLLSPFIDNVKTGHMYMTVVMSIVADIVQKDPNVLSRFVAVTGSKVEDADIVGVVILDFQRYKVVEILTLAIEAGLT